MKCPKCKRDNQKGASFCSHCGAPLSSEKVCDNCHKSNPVDSAFCTHCGKSFNNGLSVPSASMANQKGKKYVVAAFVVLVVLLSIVLKGKGSNNPETGSNNPVEGKEEMVECNICCNTPDVIPGKCPMCNGTRILRGYNAECVFCINGNCVKCDGQKMILASRIKEPIMDAYEVAARREAWKSGHEVGTQTSSNTFSSVCSSCNGTKRCDNCAGRGEKEFDSGYDGLKIMDCPVCDGTGKCQTCKNRYY